jgi:hypothetical protein
MSEVTKDQATSGADITRRAALATAGGLAVAAVTGGAAGGAEKFNPNKMTFAEGIERIKKALQTVPAFHHGKIVTSRDEGADKLRELLMVSNIPTGFTKYQLPVFFERGPGAQFFISIGAPDVEVPMHSHDEGDGMRFIASGSVIYDGKELSAGDWMFIPKKQPYSMKVGKNGVTMYYCYQCCCG